MRSVQRYGIGPRFSQAVAYGDLIFMAAQIADDTNLDIGDQTKQVLRKLDLILQQAGSDKTKLLKVDLWLANINDFDAMNIVWDEWVSAQNTPARVTVEARLVPGYLIEATAVAVR